MMKYLFCLFWILAAAGCVSAPRPMRPVELKYAYSQLKLLDLEQMSDLIQEHLNQYKKTGNPEALEEALVICLARPDSDHLVDKLIESIRYGVESNEQWESGVDRLVQKSIERLRDESTAVEDQLSYIIILQNLIAEFRPEFVKQYQSPMFESRIIEKIARSGIEISSEADAEGRLTLMSAPVSPSEIAGDLIEDRTVSLKGR